MLPRLPALAHDLVSKLNDADLSNQNQVAAIEKLRTDIVRAQRRQYVGLVGAVLLLSAAILSALDGYAPMMILDAPLMSWVLGGLGVLLLLFTWPESR